MIFPSLVKKEFCKTPIKVYIHSEELDSMGNPKVFEYNGLCNYQSSTKSIFIDDKKVVQLSGKAYIPTDIFEEFDELTDGEVELFNNGIKRKLYRLSKARNLDGSVNFVVLELV